MTHLCSLLCILHQLEQEPSQFNHDCFAKMHAVWDEFTLSKPTWVNQSDATQFLAYCDRLYVMQFLIKLSSDFEQVCASLLHLDSFPKLKVVIVELLSKETRLEFFDLGILQYPLILLLLSFLAFLLANSFAITIIRIVMRFPIVLSFSIKKK